MSERNGGMVEKFPPTRILLIIGAVILALAVPATFILGQTAQSATDQAKSAVQQLQPAKEQAQQGTDLASKIILACTDPSQVQQLQAIGACQQAIHIQQQAPTGPTDSQIASAVDKWLSDHADQLKGAPPTETVIAAVVAQYMIQHPAQPGRPPSPDEISMATAAYISTHADQFKGAKGDSPSSAEILTAVQQFCGTTPSPCAGPAGPAGQNGADGTNGSDGKQGAQGISVTDLNFVRSSTGECQLVVTLYDPASKTNVTVVHSAPDVVCPVAVSPTTTTKAAGGNTHR